MSDPSKGLRFGAGSAFASTGGADLVGRLPRPGFPEPTYFNETKWFSCPGRPHAQDPNKLPLKYAGKLAPDKINHPCLVCDKAIYDGRIALNLKKYVDLLANNECKIKLARGAFETANKLDHKRWAASDSGKRLPAQKEALLIK